MERTQRGEVHVHTPPDPRTGVPDRILDPPDWIHTITTQIPDPGQHLVRYYAWYSNRTRGRRLARRAGKARAKPPEPADASAGARASWARLLRRVFEIDPLVCPGCGSEMKVVSVITDPAIVDRILRHLSDRRKEDPFEQGRAPPAA